jgi:hypothetical protein
MGLISDRSLAFLIVVLSISVRLFLFFALDRAGIVTHGETDLVAASIAERGEFANPFLVATGPTAHLPPGYPVLLGGIYWIFRSPLYREYAEEVLGVLSVTAVFALLPLFSLNFLGTRLPGIFAGLIGAINPAPFITETNGRESPLASAVFFFVCWLTASVVRKGSSLGWVGAGVAWSLLLLIQPAFLLPAVAAAIILLFMTGRAYAKQLLIAGLAAGLVLVPWAVRNTLVFQKVIVFRGNLGLEVFTSFHDGVGVDAGPQNLILHPFGNADAAEALKRVGEVRYNQERMHEGLDWIARHPVDTVSLILGRIVAFWFPYYRSAKIFVPTFAVSTLAMAGVFLLIRTRHRAAIWIAALLLSYPMTYYFFQSALRYRYPIEWVLYLCGGFAVATFAKHFGFVTAVD